MTRPIFVISLVILGGTACASPNCPDGTVLAASDRCVPIDELVEEFGDAGMADGDGGTPDAGVTATDDDGGAPDAGDAPCVPTGEVDAPDALRIDADCDGIDGAMSSSIFVAEIGDDANDGMTPEAPVRTIGRAIEIAETIGRGSVLVAAGSYEEQIMLVPGVSLYGGYDAESGFTRTATERAIVAFDGMVLVAEDVEEDTLVSELDLVAHDAAPGASSIAVRLLRASGVVLERVAVTAGRGGDGADGLAATGSAGTGSVGAAGLVARLDGTMCSAPVGTFRPEGGIGGMPAAGCSGCGTGGTGGRGQYLLGTAVMAAMSGANGENGAEFACALSDATGGDGGAAGTTVVRAGTRGTTGATGATGAAGRGGLAFGSIGGAAYYNQAHGGRGAVGTSGEGGGGGGGGSGCVERSIATGAVMCVASGGGGGGGGSGGCGGAGGYGGDGGGASIAVLAIQTAVRIVGGELATRAGGAGGDGTTGLPGGAGGSGMNGGAAITYGACTTGAGGRGGDGGRGGVGGQGGGGGGGPSVGIALDSASTVAPSSDYTVTLGDGGAGGAGGVRGNDGIAAETHAE